MRINTKLHTVYLLVGSIGCGKSTFTEEILRKQLQFEAKEKGFKSNVQVISSDQICLSKSDDNDNPMQLEEGVEVFELLYRRLDQATTFPVNAEFVIVDTMGFSADFRATVRDIAQGNQYFVEVIVFNYEDHSDFFKGDASKRIISNHLIRLQKEVMLIRFQEQYEAVHVIKKKGFLENSTYQVNIENKAAFLATLLSQNYAYGIIGDVHECVSELQGLIQKFDFDIQNGLVIPTEKSLHKKLIFVGDWIDKGRQTVEMVDFMYRNKEHFLLTLGNHENFVYKYLQGEIGGANQETVDNYFTSIPHLKENDEAREKFNHLVEISQPFFKYEGPGEPFYVTHSPCKNKYLGKLDPHSLRHQRTFKLDRKEDTEVQIKFLEE